MSQELSLFTILQKHLAQVSRLYLTVSHWLDLPSCFLFTHIIPIHSSRLSYFTLRNISWCPQAVNSCGTFYFYIWHLLWFCMHVYVCQVVFLLFCVPNIPNPYPLQKLYVIHWNCQSDSTQPQGGMWSRLYHNIHSLKSFQQESLSYSIMYCKNVTPELSGVTFPNTERNKFKVNNLKNRI